MSAEKSESQMEILLEEEQKQEQERKHFKVCLFKSIYLSLCFMLLFSAFNSAQNMVAQVYENLGYGSLGNIALFSLYFAFGISSFFGAQLVSLARPKIIFILSGLAYNCFCLVGFIVVHCPDRTTDLPFQCQKPVLYSYIIFASILCGVAAATIWVSQGGYIEAVSLKCPSKSAIFVGIFWSIMQISQILGNTLSYFLLGGENGTITYFTIMLIIGCVGNVFFIFLPSVSMEGVQKKETPKVSRMIKLIKLKEVRPLMTFMGFTGVIIAFYSGFLFKIIQNSLTQEQRDDKSISNQKTAQVFIVLGICEFISGLVSGQLASRFNLYNLATIGTLLAEIALVLSLLGYFLEQYFLTFIIAAIWGFSDCYFNVICQEICNKDYPDYIEIFALFRLVLAFSNSITQVLAITITKEWIFILIIVILQMGTNIGTRMLKKPDMSKLNEGQEVQQNQIDNSEIAQDNELISEHSLQQQYQNSSQ